MNLERLSKNAESYSSASMTKTESFPKLAGFSKFSEIPPTRYPISIPDLKIYALTYMKSLSYHEFQK